MPFPRCIVRAGTVLVQLAASAVLSAAQTAVMGFVRAPNSDAAEPESHNNTHSRSLCLFTQQHPPSNARQLYLGDSLTLSSDGCVQHMAACRQHSCMHADGHPAILQLQQNICASAGLPQAERSSWQGARGAQVQPASRQGQSLEAPAEALLPYVVSQEVCLPGWIDEATLYTPEGVHDCKAPLLQLLPLIWEGIWRQAPQLKEADVAYAEAGAWRHEQGHLGVLY